MSVVALVTVQNGTPTTTSLAIAEGTDNEHRAVLQLIRNNRADFDEFGRVAFEMQPFATAGGMQQREVAILTEEHATLLLTYMRNRSVVRDFKKRLVREFWELRRCPAPALQGPELLAAAVLESQRMLEAKDIRIAQLNDKIALDAPKVGYIDQFVTDADLLSFSTVASTCNITEKRLRELLIERGWIYFQTDSRWSEAKGMKVERRRYSEKADKKRYFRRVETHEAPRFRGCEVMHTLKITPAGAEAISRRVTQWSVSA